MIIRRCECRLHHTGSGVDIMSITAKSDLDYNKCWDNSLENVKNIQSASYDENQVNGYTTTWASPASRMSYCDNQS